MERDTDNRTWKNVGPEKAKYQNKLDLPFVNIQEGVNIQ